MICKLIMTTAIKYAIPVFLLSAVIHQESNFNPNAVNTQAPIHSYGLGQLTANTAWSFCKLPKRELLNLEKNLDCSARVLAYQLDRYKDLDKAISAYNAGSYTPRNKSYIQSINLRVMENKCEVRNEDFTS